MRSLVDQYWTRESAGATRLGLAPDFVESLEGNWIAIELAPVAAVLRAGDSFGFLTTDRATHDLRAPFAFRVVEVNPAAIENPSLVRLSPTGAGWLLEVARRDVDAEV